MTASEDDFPAPLPSIGYVRELYIHGDKMWALLDSDGEIVCFSTNRSEPYFYAATHEVTVIQRH